MRRVRPYRFVPQTYEPADPVGRTRAAPEFPPPEPLFCVSLLPVYMIVIPWAFSPRTCSVGKAGIH